MDGGLSFRIEIGHDEKVRAVGFAYVVDAADVWMVEGGDGPRLALEARAQARIVCDVARQDLDRDDPVKSGVSALVHLTHAARATLGSDFIGAEARAGSQGQV
jgi:hypothetical protein